MDHDRMAVLLELSREAPPPTVPLQTTYFPGYIYSMDYWPPG